MLGPDLNANGLFSPTVALMEVVLRTFIVYVVVLLGLRLFGKRELGQMTPFDLVLLLTLSNAVQNAMTGGDNSLNAGLVSAATLLASNRLLNTIGMQLPWVKRWLVGAPTLLVHDGKIISQHMRREGIDEDELLQAARQHEMDSIEEIGEAVLEVDGTISIIPQGTQSHKYRRKKHSQRMR